MNRSMILAGLCSLMAVLGTPTLVLAQSSDVGGVQKDQVRSLSASVSVQGFQTFAELMQQAELEAQRLIESEFAANSDVANVSVTIAGERHGQEVPILVLSVSRADWQAQPIVQNWAKNMGQYSQVLLGFLDSQLRPVATARTTGNGASPSAIVAANANQYNTTDDIYAPPYQDPNDMVR